MIPTYNPTERTSCALLNPEPCTPSNKYINTYLLSSLCYQHVPYRIPCRHLPCNSNKPTLSHKNLNMYLINNQAHRFSHFHQAYQHVLIRRVNTHSMKHNQVFQRCTLLQPFLNPNSLPLTVSAPRFHLLTVPRGILGNSVCRRTWTLDAHEQFAGVMGPK